MFDYNGVRPPEQTLEAAVRDPWSDYECHATPPDVIACADPRTLGESYVYLLGVYLGDGMISPAPRNVWKLRIFQDARYTQILEEISVSIEAITSRQPGRTRKQGCVELYSNWKHWHCLFPQHAPGPKHLRAIVLREWQRRLVERHPANLLRGLIHSDGCRVLNRVHRPTKSGLRHYLYPRYHFTNASADIRQIFSTACELAGVDCRPNNERNISVARRASVALLDSFIGPKR